MMAVRVWNHPPICVRNWTEGTEKVFWKGFWGCFSAQTDGRAYPSSGGAFWGTRMSVFVPFVLPSELPAREGTPTESWDHRESEISFMPTVGDHDFENRIGSLKTWPAWTTPSAGAGHAVSFGSCNRCRWCWSLSERIALCEARERERWLQTLVPRVPLAGCGRISCFPEESWRPTSDTSDVQRQEGQRVPKRAQRCPCNPTCERNTGRNATVTGGKTGSPLLFWQAWSDSLAVHGSWVFTGKRWRLARHAIRTCMRCGPSDSEQSVEPPE